ncbi:MAG: hypothetical protein GXX93_04065 [Anaerolineae bacterium]|nr:hypothetical protein [Anaerolineae bacterium]
MNRARYDHSAAWLSDGRVLVVGGRSGEGLLDSVEFYGPATPRVCLPQVAVRH